MTTPKIPHQPPTNISIEQLQDVVLPLEPGVWPLAIGWWLLIAVGLVSIFMTIRYVIAYRKLWEIKRFAFTRLSQCNDCNDINQLLKQVAMHYCDNPRVSSLTGAPWVSFLSLNVDEPSKTSLTEINDALYTSHQAQYFQQFKPIANQWLLNLNAGALTTMNDAY